MNPGFHHVWVLLCTKKLSNPRLWYRNLPFLLEVWPSLNSLHPLGPRVSCNTSPVSTLMVMSKRTGNVNGTYTILRMDFREVYRTFSLTCNFYMYQTFNFHEGSLKQKWSSLCTNNAHNVHFTNTDGSELRWFNLRFFSFTVVQVLPTQPLSFQLYDAAEAYL